MDDEERRFIGDLLSGEDDVFQSAAGGGGGGAQAGGGGGASRRRSDPTTDVRAVVAPAGPIIGAPSGMGNYWPEPPPPYSPPLHQQAPPIPSPTLRQKWSYFDHFPHGHPHHQQQKAGDHPAALHSNAAFADFHQHHHSMSDAAGMAPASRYMLKQQYTNAPPGLLHHHQQQQQLQARRSDPSQFANYGLPPHHQHQPSFGELAAAAAQQQQQLYGATSTAPPFGVHGRGGELPYGAPHGWGEYAGGGVAPPQQRSAPIELQHDKRQMVQQHLQQQQRRTSAGGAQPTPLFPKHPVPAGYIRSPSSGGTADRSADASLASATAVKSGGSGGGAVADVQQRPSSVGSGGGDQQAAALPPKPGYRFSDAVAKHLPPAAAVTPATARKTQGGKLATGGGTTGGARGGPTDVTAAMLLDKDEAPGSGDRTAADDDEQLAALLGRASAQEREALRRSRSTDFQKITHGKKTKKAPAAGGGGAGKQQQADNAATDTTPPGVTRFQVLSAVPTAQFNANDGDRKHNVRKNSDEFDETDKGASSLAKQTRGGGGGAASGGGGGRGDRAVKGGQKANVGGNRRKTKKEEPWWLVVLINETDKGASSLAKQTRGGGGGAASGGGGGRGDRAVKGGQKANVGGNRRKTKKEKPWWLVVLINVVVVAAVEYAKRGCRWLYDLVTDIALQLSDVVVYVGSETYARLQRAALRALHWTSERARAVSARVRALVGWCGATRAFTAPVKGVNDLSWGLRDNIQLPTTGDEAMRRLLQTRGEDAYSILGLKTECTDDDIKRYYKRQAVLVHPDKNSAYGADEAFKVLAQAFEMIGSPQRRLAYNSANIHRDPAMQELDKLMEKLRQKMEEALSTMHCDCGGRHRRFKTDRPLSEARYCRKCKEHHPSRENDIWAESRWGGLVWCYYACMDQAVYDVTQWAGCPRNLLKHMKANSHAVQYRLMNSGGTSANQQQRSSNANQHPSSSNAQQSRKRAPSDAELESLLSRFLSSSASSGAGAALPDAPATDDAAHASYRPPDRPAGGMPRKAGRRRKNK